MVSLVKNFFTTPAIAYPLYSSMFLRGAIDDIFDSSMIIYYSYYIEPLFLNIPYMFKIYVLHFKVSRRITKGRGRPYGVSF